MPPIFGDRVRAGLRHRQRGGAMPQLSIIIPVLDEAAGIVAALDRARAVSASAAPR